MRGRELMTEDASLEDRVLARWLFDFLEDRRVLYNASYAENPQFVVVSVSEIRDYLSTLLTEKEPGEVLTKSARTMRGACRRFLDSLRQFESAERYPGNTERSEIAANLGEFRGRIGNEVELLSNHFNLEVPGDLRNVLPPSPE
jgi:hypothetical protein